MQFGCCGSLDEVKKLEELGFDYVECSVVGMVNEPFRSDLTIPVFNSFLPGDLKVCGPEVDWEKVKNYLEKACKKVKDYGGEIIVFGSGGARRVPEGFSRDKAWGQIKDFLNLAADIAKKNEIIIAVEPLRSQETNILNTLDESLKMVMEVNRPEIKQLADLYHIEEENEPYGHIKDAGDLLVHVHVADSGRFYPGSGEYDYETFFTLLKEVSYDSRVSIECRWEDKMKEAEKGLQFLRKYQ